MKAKGADNLTNMFSQPVAADHISFDWLRTSSQRWRLIDGQGYSFLDELRRRYNCDTPSLVAFSLPR